MHFVLRLLQAYGDQGVECGSLDVIGLHELIESSTIRSCGFIGVGMTLLKEVCHYG